MDGLPYTEVLVQYALPMLITGLVAFALMRLLDHTVHPIRTPADVEHVTPLGG